MRACAVLTLGVIISCAAGASSADIFRVDDDAAPGGDGSSWGRAFDSLTDALAAASSGDQIWIAEGEYIPDTPAGPDATFLIPDGVQVYGGFEGDENSLAERGDPLDPRVTLNGGAAVYHVVEIINAGPGTILDGLVITKGFADGAGPNARGGGVYADDSAPTLRNIVFTENFAASRGGALALDGSVANFATISDCQFLDNTSDSSAGAAGAEVSTTFERCVFNSNSASSSGALRLAGTGVHSLFDCEFRSNSADVGTGGAVTVVMTASDAVTIFDGCDFRSNSNTQAGAIAYLFDGDHEIRGSRFIDNSSTSSGANAIRFGTDVGTTLLIENCLVSGNDGQGAGAINNESDGTLRIVNSTISHNALNTNGGAVFAADGHTDLDNTIIWGNTTVGSGGQDISLWTNLLGTVSADRCIIQFLGVGDPVPPGFGSFSGDPMFVDADGSDNNPGTPDDNVRLMPGSPAIDFGNNLLLGPFGSLDYYGDPRFHDDTGTPDNGVGDGVNAIVDLGCAEIQGTTPGGPCNPADLAEPFGALDFSDVLAFLTAFGGMQPAADLAPPLGVYDFSDVLAFLTAFGAGCP